MHIRQLFCAALAGAVLAGCDGIATNGATVEPPIPAMPTVPATTDITTVTADNLPQAVLTGPALDLNWRDRYSATVAYVNSGPQTIDVFSGPDGQDVMARLAPGNGGGIDACAVEVDMCSITFGPERQRGWVFMTTMIPQAAG